MADTRSFAVAAHGRQRFGAEPVESRPTAVLRVSRGLGLGAAYMQAARRGGGRRP